ncbi:MAG: ABC transporter ATP-binding protein [Geminicoccaceae bacterium]
MSRLEVRGLAGGYSTADHILKGVDLTVEPEQITAIIGPNGAGKSTLLKAVAGLIRIQAGTIELDGKPLAGLSPRAIAGHGIGFVPQEANVFASMSVNENLEMGGWLASDTAERQARLYERFPMLAEKRRATAGSLSGGQRQILAMAMAMMTEPRILLLDEPTAGLSPVAAGELFDTVDAIRASGVAIAMVEQNAMAALRRADMACLLVDGANARTGRAASFLEDASIREIFLGERPVQDGAEEGGKTR